ncbi:MULTISPECIES: YlxR family protein [Actinomycetaceae]|uniref:YlxR family protein n=1 Tax=Actinomycetaceae TaxID=2049 RepID=UPI0022E75E89|nr:YlxR family protein [Pauljensenia sp. OF14-1SRA]
MVRTCVGCSRRALRADLIRVVVSKDGVCTVDPTSAQPGRGAWIHPDPTCIETARKRRAFQRALSCEGDIDAHMWDQLGQVASSRAHSALVE